MTGFIMFSMVEIRPDIAFATSMIAQFAKNLGYQYTKEVITVLQYFKGSREREITFSSQDKLFLEGYSDSNWAQDKEDRKSTSEFIFILNSRPVS